MREYHSGQCVVSADAKRSACATPTAYRSGLRPPGSVSILPGVAPSWRECRLPCSPRSGCALPSVKRVAALPESVAPPPPGGTVGTLFPFGDLCSTLPQYCPSSPERVGAVALAGISARQDGWPSARGRLCAPTSLGVVTCPSPSALPRQLPSLSGMRRSR